MILSTQTSYIQLINRFNIIALNTGCFEKSFTNLKEYINLFRGHAECFEMS
jgi:hypothetical protein